VARRQCLSCAKASQFGEGFVKNRVQSATE
jgi:hypothetical protein